MHRTVMRLEMLFRDQETQEQLQQITAVQGLRTPRSETRYEKLERATAESKGSSSGRSRKPFSPTMWAAAASDSAFVGLVPPYGEQYSPYARQVLRSVSTDSESKARKADKKKYVQKPKRAGTARECERAFHPYKGATTWRESCRVRGPLARYPLYEAPSHTSKQVGSVKSGGHVEVLRTDIGHRFASQAESSVMWVLLAQGGWLRAASQFCSASYGEWLAQAGDGTDSGPTAVLQTVERPGSGTQCSTSKVQSNTGRNKRRGAPKVGSARHTRPFYT